MEKKEEYSKEEIKGVDHIRSVKLRPMMYIGEINTNGFLNLLLYNFLEEVEKVAGEIVDFRLTFLEDDNFKLEIKNAIVENLISFINPPTEPATWKSGLIFDLRMFIGFTESSSIFIESGGKNYLIESENEQYEVQIFNAKNSNENVIVNFKLDANIFKNIKLNLQVIRERFTEYAYLNPSVKILLENEIENDTKELFHFPKGIFEKLEVEIAKQTTTKPLFIFNKLITINDFKYHIAFCFLDNWTAQTYVKTYAENDYLFLGGSLEDGIINGIKSAVQASVGEEQKIKKRKLLERLILIAQVKGENASECHFDFGHSIKGRLVMPQIEKDVCKFVHKELKVELDKMKKLMTLIRAF